MENKQPASPTRWTRDYVFDILKDLGIHYIFGVPGTNEIPIIDGTSYPENEVEYIECLHENIAIGAAMGSARMTGKPGVLVVHVTPGIAHSIGNLFNACRSEMPLVILCCQQQNELVTQEPLLASNLVELARQYTKWSHEVRTPDEIAMVLQRAFKEAMAPPNGPVFISIPWDFTMVAIEDNQKVKGVTRISPHFTGDEATIKQAAGMLSAASKPVIVAGDAVGYADAWAELQELATLIGAPVVLQTFSSVANFPNNDYHWQGELPGSQAGIQAVFKEHDVAFLVGFGAQAQLAVYKYSDGPLFPPHLKQIYLTNNTWDIAKNYYGEAAIFGDIKVTLPLLNAQIKSEGAAARNDSMKLMAVTRTADWDAYLHNAMQQKEIWSVVIAKALKDAIEERKMMSDFVYVHEAISDSAPFQYYLPFGTTGAKPISYYCVAGGSLGWSMPASLGIKLEKETVQGIGTRLVINAVGDGSSLFYPQTWWTAAHRQLPILYIITNNQEYHTLQLGLQQVVASYGTAPGYGWTPKTMDPSYLKLERPQLDFVSLAKAFGGQDGEIVRTPDAVKDAVERGIDHVLNNASSYILDMRIAANAPITPTTSMQHYIEQPVLDVFHKQAFKTYLLETDKTKVPSNMPSIF
ncbi:thiamine pyrophosphate-binding protein [Chitinophaga oryziterrae]|uniref:Thiamine pyrophosphate-binding protein n=1 Tax=Chitinophaga oryziterrae TaxID=1031224 RepID=A0A6N8JGA4_9BACT|nr:thiamine pyrophosphate-binding protein [Chitinophaga oryziterrae]MVT43389.1 thiamine pyrophosphate-binding protein [Chitinophaga oryziterrae]